MEEKITPLHIRLYNNVVADIMRELSNPIQHNYYRVFVDDDVHSLINEPIYKIDGLYTQMMINWNWFSVVRREIEEFTTFQYDYDE